MPDMHSRPFDDCTSGKQMTSRDVKGSKFEISN